MVGMNVARRGAMQLCSPQESMRPFGCALVAPGWAYAAFASDAQIPSERDATARDGTCLPEVEVVQG